MANGTRLWIYCAPGGSTPLDESADPNQAFNANSLESMAIKSNKDSRRHTRKAGGSNATFAFPARGQPLVGVLGRAIAGPETRPDRDPQRLSGDQGRHALKRGITQRCG